MKSSLAPIKFIVVFQKYVKDTAVTEMSVRLRKKRNFHRVYQGKLMNLKNSENSRSLLLVAHFTLYNQT